MAFTYTIVNRVQLAPGNKRKEDAGPLYMVWGTFVSDGGSTGGAINTEGTKVKFASAHDEDGANAIQVQPNVASDGQFTITTTANVSGHWMAIIRDRK